MDADAKYKENSINYKSGNEFWILLLPDIPCDALLATIFFPKSISIVFLLCGSFIILFEVELCTLVGISMGLTFFDINFCGTIGMFLTVFGTIGPVVYKLESTLVSCFS